MNAAELDAKVRAYRASQRAQEALDRIDRALSRSPRVRSASRLEWLERRARAGYPLPGTPEWDAELDAFYGPALTRVSAPGCMDWDGVWRTTTALSV